MLVQEPDEKAGDPDLRGEIEAGAEAEDPHAAIAHRAAHVREVGAGSGRGADERERDDAAGEGRRAEDDESELRAAGVGEPRQERGGGRAADRNRRLAHAEGEPALRGGEPAHHGTAARRVHARAERAGGEEREHERQVGVRPPGEEERGGREHEPERDHELLADAIGEEAPREEREEHADADGAEHDAGLAQRQAVVRAQRWRERRQTDRERREARLRERACSEDHPAITRARISFALRTSSASGPLLSGPAVSITAGSPCRRGFARKTPSRSPSKPSPLFAWRARFEPSGAAESFTCSARSRSSPIDSSSSSSSASSCVASVTSTPET